MRLLFLFLLLFNGLVYIWYAFSEQPVNASTLKLDPGLPKLVLLSELPPSALVQDEPELASENEEPVTAEVEKPERLCYTLGPFMNNDDMVEASKKLILSGRPFEKRASEKREQIGYWVFIPPFNTREAATDVGEELKLLGEKELYIVKTPVEYKNAISLGVFKGKANAKRRYQQIKNMGYDVKLEGRFRQNPIYWLDYSESDNPQDLALADFVGAQRLARSCETVASSKPLP